MGFLIFDVGDAVPDREAHFHRRVGNGYAACIPGDGPVRECLVWLGVEGSMQKKEASKRYLKFLLKI